MKIESALFTVEHRPYCVRDWEMRKANLHFVNSIDSKYFEYIANVHTDHIDGEDKQRSATALRASWFHGLETMFALICAALQAPECVLGWMGKYRTDTLRRMVAAISARSVDFIVKCPIHPVSWESISDEIIRVSYPDHTRIQSTKDLFANLWKRFASDFVNDKNISEYNSIKHGARTSAGGFSLAVGIEKEYGVPAPLENMHLLGMSEFGSSFPILAPIGVAKKNPNFRIVTSSVNWSPEATIYALKLISYSVNNIKSYLLLTNGIPTAEFLRPKDDESFDKPWDFSPGVLNMTMNSNIEEEMIRGFTNEEILANLKNRFSSPNGAGS